MTKEYDHITAFHYSAFRPALHSQILKEHLDGHPSFSIGLDVGSGVGHSSIALMKFCKKVVGVEPSEEMLSKSIPYPGIKYVLYDGNHFDFENEYFDVITFAGSLHYAKSAQLLYEIIRVSKNGAKIVIYDFEMLLDDILGLLGIERDLREKSEYDHQVNFSGLNRNEIEVGLVAKKSVTVEIRTPDLAHLLLSSKDNYRLLPRLFGPDDLYGKVLHKLNSVLTVDIAKIEAITNITIYNVMK